MPCEDKQTALEAAVRATQELLKQELSQIAADAEAKAKALSDDFEEGNDLAEGVGATAGTIAGAVIGGAGGAVIGGAVGKAIGSLFWMEITEKEVRVALDLPEVTVADQEWKFNVPSVELRDSDIIFNLPTLVMKRVEGPPIPETVCEMEQRCINLPFGGRACTDVPVCKVRFKKTFLDIPTWEDREQRIVIGVPQVIMREERWVVGVPQVSMRTQELTFKVPSITIRFVQDAGKKTASAAAEIAQEAATASHSKQETLKEKMRFELLPRITELFDCHRSNIRASMDQVAATFDPEIQRITDALKDLKVKGVPETDDDYISVKAKLDEVLAQRQASLKSFEDALARLDEAAKEALEKLVSPAPPS